jgi:hypothetical protein
MSPNDNKGTEWMPVGDEGNLVTLDVGENLVFAIDDEDQVWARTGIHQEALVGSDWIRVPGLMMQLSLY